MHNIDRTQLEFESALQELQPEAFEFSGETGEHEQTEWEAVMLEAGANEGGFQEAEVYEGTFQETAGEWEGGIHEAELYEAEAHEAQAYEGAFQEAGVYEAGNYEVYAGEATNNEALEMELAAEFLEINNEAELDQFLGKLIRRVGRAAGKFARSKIGRAIGGVLKPLAKAALPLAGKAVGGFFGGPLGAMVGGKLAGMAGQAFGLELEGLSGEDREFEVARRFVRLASVATRNALSAPPQVPPVAAARTAVIAAARKVAPGFARRLRRPSGYRPPFDAGFDTPVGYPGGDPPVGGRRRGIWVRRGRGILLLGV